MIGRVILNFGLPGGTGQVDVLCLARA